MNLWPTFEDFWTTYRRKGSNKKKSLELLDKLKQEEKEAIMAHVPEYMAATEEKYRKHATTYLNGRCWEDEIFHERRNTSSFFASTEWSEIISDPNR